MGSEIPTPVTEVSKDAIAPNVAVSVKYAEIFKSPRFHLLVVGFLVQTARQYNYIDDYMANSIIAFLVSVIGINTVDRFNQKPAPAAPGIN